MDKDRIVNEIVAQVLQALNQCSLNGENSTLYNSYNTTNRVANMDKPYDIYVVGNQPIQYTITGLNCIPISNNYQKGEPILITFLSPYMLANLANGQATTCEEECILYNLLHGYDVYLLEDGLTYQLCKRTAYKALYNLYRDYDDKLRNYGVKVIHEPIEIIKVIARPEYEPFSKNNSISNEPRVTMNQQYQEDTFIGKVDWRKRHLLLEKDFINSRIQSDRSVMLMKNCIITPMARDYIREHQIHIELY